MFLFVLHSIGVGEGVVARTGGGAQAGLLVGGFFARRDAEGYEHTQHTCTNTERYREMKNWGGGGQARRMMALLSSCCCGMGTILLVSMPSVDTLHRQHSTDLN